MKRKFTFLNLFLACISFLIINTKFSSNVVAEESLNIELNKEIEKGNFLIGLKQYLGGTNDGFSQQKTINFITDKGSINLHSSNDIKNKSKKISIIRRDIPIKNPEIIERVVFGPF